MLLRNRAEFLFQFKNSVVEFYHFFGLYCIPKRSFLTWKKLKNDLLSTMNSEKTIKSFSRIEHTQK